MITFQPRTLLKTRVPVVLHTRLERSEHPPGGFSLNSLGGEHKHSPKAEGWER